MLGVLTDSRFLIGAAVGYFILPRVVKAAMGQVDRMRSKPAAASS